MKAIPFSQNELQEILDYDPNTGVMTWLITNSNRAVVGTEAGTIRNVRGNYKRTVIAINGERYYRYRLIWVWMTGEQPNIIDHINGDTTDDRWVNLRNVTASQNLRNARVSKNNKLGVMGVCRHKKGYYVAQLMKRGKRYHKIFANKEDAIAQRKEWEQEHFGEYSYEASRV